MRPVRRRGFTLVELLVCVSVIGLLAAILCPVAWAVRNRAVGVACANNLRQLGYAFGIYASQYGGLLPHEDNGDTLPPFGCGWDKVLVPVAGDERLFGCPAEPFAPEVRSYKMNSLLEEEGRWFFQTGAARQPAATILLFDGRTENPGVRKLPKGTWSLAARRHAGATNLLFIDGHVESHEPAGGGSGWPGPGPYRWRPFQK